jgi:hypothetical protein
LSGDNLWPANIKSADSFEQLALRELKLAARMDCLAARRALAAKRLRRSQKVKSSELQRLSEQMHNIAKEFKELWLSRNKLSRLHDNLRLFHGAEKELSQLAGKRKRS